MRRIVATLAVIALLFSVGSAWADDNSEANKLFVEAVKLVNSAENIEDPIKKADALEEALAMLNEIVDDYPTTDLAVKLISEQSVGIISLASVRLAVKKLTERIEKNTRRIEKNTRLCWSLPKSDPKKCIFFYDVEWPLTIDTPLDLQALFQAAEEGRAGAQNTLGILYAIGEGVERNTEKSVMWWLIAYKNKHPYASENLEPMKFAGLYTQSAVKLADEWWEEHND